MKTALLTLSLIAILSSNAHAAVQCFISKEDPKGSGQHSNLIWKKTISAGDQVTESFAVMYLDGKVHPTSELERLSKLIKNTQDAEKFQKKINEAVLFGVSPVTPVGDGSMIGLSVGRSINGVTKSSVAIVSLNNYATLMDGHSGFSFSCMKID